MFLYEKKKKIEFIIKSILNKINLLIQENNIVVVVTFYQFMKQMIGLIWGEGGDGMEWNERGYNINYCLK